MAVTKIAAMLGVVLVGTFLVLASLQTTPVNEYSEFKARFGYKFEGAEDAYRKSIFEQTVKSVNHHNSLLGTSYKMGLNQFSAMSDEEFAKTFLTLDIPTSTLSEEAMKDVTVGADVDWVAYGAVSPVKDQGSSCSPSYAFSAIGAMEAGSYIWWNNATEFSVQQVVDCSSSYGNNGCYNGRMDNTFLYVKDRAINTWASYPYVGYLQSCKSATGIFRISGYSNVTSCTALSSALLNIPISVAVDAANWRSYSFGIFSNCGTNLNLAALLVGMTDNYWRVKNSWGTSWGEAGYIRLSRGNTCGICSMASYPLK